MTSPLASPPSTIRRVVYMGTPEVAVPPLHALVAAGFEIPLVISAKDKRRGRGSALSPSPVKAAALELGLEVSDRVEDVLEVEADLAAVVAFGQIIRPNVLAQVPMVNLHFSLLPRWRGAAPVERALLEGDHETGVCLMAVEEGLDTGGIYRQANVSIGPIDTLDSLRGTLIELGAELLVQGLSTGLGVPRAQAGEAVYAKKIKPEELRIDWDEPSHHIDRQIRLGRAWTTFRGKRFRVWKAEMVERSDLNPGQLDGLEVGTADGTLRLEIVQPEGKPRMAATAWKNGAQPKPTEALS